MKKGPYTRTGRLADVLALIQVLALDKHIHRSEEGVSKRELFGPPLSAPSWTSLAKQHPEFFRVAPTGDHVLSLVARHVLPTQEDQEAKPLPADFTFRLLETAIDLHDRQVTAASRWKDFLPVLAALIGGIFGTVSALATLWLKSCNLP